MPRGVETHRPDRDREQAGRRARGAVWRLRIGLLLLTLLVVGLVFAGYTWVRDVQAWRAALLKQGFVDEMAPLSAEDRIVVFAPHPDDEALGCGGVIQEALAQGARVDVVLVTNGDASEMSLIFGEKDVFVSPKAMIGLGRTRQEESLHALSKFGLPAARVHFLGYPNNGLTQLWQPEHWRARDRYSSPKTHTAVSPYSGGVTPRAVYCGQQVLSDLVTLLHELRPTKVFLPHPKDVHPDHWATSCFVQYAVATASVQGDEWASAVEQYGYLVHWPQFPEPARCSLGLDLLPPADLTGADARWLRLDLTPSFAQRKLETLRSYRSQVPQVDPFLTRFARANETFEQVRPRTWAPSGSTVWKDQGGRRHSLGGAEIDQVDLLLGPGGRASATLRNGGRKLRAQSYVALDLRAWDARGRPVIVGVKVRPRGGAQVTRIIGDSRTTAPVLLDGGRDGLSLEYRLPPELLTEEGCFVSCWGSLRDRVVDSALASQVRPASEP